MKPSLIVLAGPTGIGKTDLSIQLANHFKTEIISADSRQIYKELKIGTAAPSEDQLKTIPHHLIGSHSIKDYYNAWEFEQDVLDLLNDLHKTHSVVVLTGGSMMYIDAICKGIDDLPTIDPELRNEIQTIYETEGLEAIQRRLKILDHEFYDQVDLKNHKRVIHAVEVCLMTGKPYSSLRTNPTKTRPFNIIKIGLDMNREELYDRINQRVDIMVKDGLLEEAREFYPFKSYNSLNTVGYKELFAYFEGQYDVDTAIELIKRNSRRYAKRQLSWFRRDEEINWYHPQQANEIIKFIESQLQIH